MSALLLTPTRSGYVTGRQPGDVRGLATPRTEDEPCGGERIIDFALCLVVAAGVVGLLLLAL